MVFDKPTFSMRYATPAAALCVLLVGILRAQAVPAGKKFVPVGKKPVTATAQRTGSEIYQQLCSSCHGASGEGGKGYKAALTGELSVGELARFIHEEMPPEAPKKLPMGDAQMVADYIHNAFYSPVAQERNRPARVELSRLTVRQYRNALSDLIASFRKAAPLNEQRGLSAKYFKERRGGQPILERVDPEIRFDFGTSGAIAGQDDPYQFMMHWQGSVLAPDTGEYEFIVRTDQATMLWVNDLKQPLIDVHVKSGNDTEYRGSVFLLGGRRYPLKLEFYKGVSGVNDLKKLKEKPVQKGSISLEWKLPKRAAEVVPQRFLFPASAPEVFVPTTPFPPDDRSIGYERGTSVSKEWATATTEAALEAASYISSHLREVTGVADDAKDRDVRLREFCRRFAERAFRRPLTDEMAEFFVERQFKSTSNVETAIKRVVLLTLKSPRFLYREVAAPVASAPTAPTPASTQPVALTPRTSAAPATGAAPDQFDVASRLSFAMWDSLPDEELLKAAAAGKLASREQVLQQAQRMVADPRAWFKMREFLLQWLKVDQYPDLAKDLKRFPGFDEGVASDLRTSLEMSLEDIVWGKKSDFRELMLTDKFFVNGRIGRAYGEILPTNAPFRLVSMDYGRRAGILTHPYLLASFAYIDNSSPIHRGVLIARSVLGRTLMPPPDAFVPLEANLHPKLTTRERVALQTQPAACSSCHNLINPLGFSLEKFDASGSLRSRENGLRVDSSGGYRSRSGKEAKFSGARDMAKFLANSEEVHSAFVEKLFQHTVKQPIKAFGLQALTNLRQSFRGNAFNMRQQMIESAILSAMKGQSSTIGAVESQPRGIPKT
jgi:mono/diheme cytochrome c family protein